MLQHVLSLWDMLMKKKRYDHFPFYWSPITDEIGRWQDKTLKFLDMALDAHEDERGPRNNGQFRMAMVPYKRMVFFFKHFNLYSNPTMANLIYETQTKNNVYQIVESKVKQGTVFHYGSMSLLHSFSFMWLTYTMRYRKVGAAPALGISMLYSFYWYATNKLSYKFFVDRPVLAATRAQGYGDFCQPLGRSRH